ncbi:MAG TPA: dephospho-CoA kinase [Firmicutes bacterium]|nr:dephospho-CoA kinase [Bacillota bacterium]
MIVVGLAGQSGAGKSTVAGMFAERGAACLDVDSVARELVRLGSPVLADIERAFGREYLLPDGSLDRRRLGGKVFSDPSALEVLNQITHPALVREAEAWIASVAGGEAPPPVAVIDAAVLFESGLVRLTEAVAVVVAGEQVQAERIARRDGIPMDEALVRVRAQRPMDEIAARADFVIRADCSLEETEAQVDKVWRLLLSGRGLAAGEGGLAPGRDQQ